MTHGLQQFQQPRLGDNVMNDAKRTVKQKAVQGMMEYLFISFYLGVVLSLFTVYKVVILAEHNIGARCSATSPGERVYLCRLSV